MPVETLKISSEIFLMSLLEGVESQYIDNNGKTRMLNYAELSLMIPPIPPLNIKRDKTIFFPTKEQALKFIEVKGLILVMQDMAGNLTQGLWVRSNIIEDDLFYIPIDDADQIPNLEIAPPHLYNPLIAMELSKLDDMKYHRKVAEFLKQYTIFEYSRNPNNFGKESFIIDTDYRYEDIASLGNRLVQNNIMYRDNKIIVPSEKVIDSLLNYLKLQKFNDFEGVKNFKNRHLIENYYNNLSDFTPATDQFIFLNRESLLRWKEESVRNKNNTTYIRPTTKEAYFYKNINIKNGILMLVQNVDEGLFKRALNVGRVWEVDRRNTGYNTKPISDNIGYTIYSEKGFGMVKSSTLGAMVHVLKYFNDGIKYSALLFI